MQEQLVLLNEVGKVSHVLGLEAPRQLITCVKVSEKPLLTIVCDYGLKYLAPIIVCDFRNPDIRTIRRRRESLNANEIKMDSSAHPPEASRTLRTLRKSFVVLYVALPPPLPPPPAPPGTLVQLTPPDYRHPAAAPRLPRRQPRALWTWP